MKNQPTKSILVVDDDAAIRDLLKAKLQKARFEVRTVANVKDCLTQVRDRTPDLILLDVNMPGGDGLSFLRKAKRQESTNRIPIIMLTAAGDIDTVMAATRGFADDFMVKPFNVDELVARIRQHLFDWTVEMIIEILAAVSTPDEGLLKQGLLGEGHDDKSVYRHSYEGREVAILAPREAIPAVVAKVSKEWIRAKIVLYEAQTGRWRRVWPTPAESAVYTKKRANG